MLSMGTGMSPETSRFVPISLSTREEMVLMLALNSKVILDPSGKPTTGSITSYSAPEFPTGTVSGTPPPASPSDADVDFTVKASHELRIEANITTGSGKQTHVVWQQQFSFSNIQHYADQANTQVGPNSIIGPLQMFISVCFSTSNNRARGLAHRPIMM